MLPSYLSPSVRHRAAQLTCQGCPEYLEHQAMMGRMEPMGGRETRAPQEHFWAGMKKNIEETLVCLEIQERWGQKGQWVPRVFQDPEVYKA